MLATCVSVSGIDTAFQPSPASVDTASCLNAASSTTLFSAATNRGSGNGVATAFHVRPSAVPFIMPCEVPAYTASALAASEKTVASTCFGTGGAGGTFAFATTLG